MLGSLASSMLDSTLGPGWPAAGAQGAEAGCGEQEAGATDHGVSGGGAGAGRHTHRAHHDQGHLALIVTTTSAIFRGPSASMASGGDGSLALPPAGW